MISPEILRKYVFFGFLSDGQLGKMAMLADEKIWKKGEKIFQINQKADQFYLLQTGEVELHYKVIDEVISDKSKEFFIGDIDPGEPLGLSALLEPFIYTATAIASADCMGISVDGKKLLQLAKEDPGLGYDLMTQVAKFTFERLGSVRVELAAARK